MVGAIVVGVAAYQTWNHVDSGTTAPNFDLAALDTTDRVSSEGLRGKATLVYFWAPWCGVCEATSHNVSDVRDAVGDDANVISIALAYKSLDKVRDFAERNEANYPVLLGNESIRADFAVESFPTFYVLDESGNVRSSVVGYTTELGLRARLWWASLRS